MPEHVSYVIIGNGIAGATAAEVLRGEDDAADITVVADDPFPVYYRPALKDYLAGRVQEDKLWARPTSFYQDFRIRFISDRVLGIQAGQHTVQLSRGKPLPYSRLLLANGAHPSRLTCPGVDLQGVTTLRTVADYQAVVENLATARRIVVVGSGTLALETVETLRHRGYPVTHLLRRRTLWSEVLDDTASDLVLQQERRDGVDIRLGEEVAEVQGKNGRVTAVRTTSGARIPCDLLLIAIGIEPGLDFIRASGIPCGRGVKVDGAMRTSAPDIYAAGDVLETKDLLTGRTRLLGQWYPSVQQAKAAAYSMLDVLDGDSPFSASTFYNATFLYGLDFASAGLTRMPQTPGYQEVMAEPQPRSYRKVLLQGGVPIGMLALGNRKDALALKRAIDHRVNLSPVLSRLFTPDFNLHSWLDQQGIPPALLGVSRAGERSVRAAAYVGVTGAAPTINTPPTLKEAFLQPRVQELPPQFTGTDLQLPRSPDAVVTIGRQPGVHLLLDHASVSRRHAEITFVNNQYLLRDVGSSNGTMVQGKRLRADEVHTLAAGDVIRFGDISYTYQEREFRVERQQAPGRASSTKLHELATGFYDPTAGAQGRMPEGQPILQADGTLLLPGAIHPLSAEHVLALRDNPALVAVVKGMPQFFALPPRGRVTLGRGKNCNIVLPEMAASRKHAEVFSAANGFYIRDLSSSNGVIVNQAKIANPYLLKHGDRIRIGSISIFYMYVGV